MPAGSLWARFSLFFSEVIFEHNFFWNHFSEIILFLLSTNYGSINVFDLSCAVEAVVFMLNVLFVDMSEVDWIRVSIRICPFLFMCTHIHIHIYLYTYTYTHTYIYIYIYAYTYIETCISIFTWRYCHIILLICMSHVVPHYAFYRGFGSCVAIVPVLFWRYQ